MLVSSNYIAGMRGELLERAFHARGLEVEWIGLTSSPTDKPEVALADVDILVGVGRTIVEAMAAGRAAYVCGVTGSDGWVTPQSYPALEADGFAGLSTGQAIDVEELAAHLDDWNPGMGEANRDLASAHHSARTPVVELVVLVRRLYAQKDVQVEPPEGPSPAGELARLVRLEWQMYGRALSAFQEAERMRGDRERYRLAAEGATAHIAKLEEYARATGQTLDAVLATRRYRLGSRLAAPVEWLRGIRRRTDRG